jgi:hypothetical protein
VPPYRHSKKQVPKHISRDGDVRSDRVPAVSCEQHPSRVRIAVERAPGHGCATRRRLGVTLLLLDMIVPAAVGEMTPSDRKIRKRMGVNVHSLSSGEQATRYHSRGTVFSVKAVEQ